MRSATRRPMHFRQWKRRDFITRRSDAPVSGSNVILFAHAGSVPGLHMHPVDLTEDAVMIATAEIRWALFYVALATALVLAWTYIPA